ncbi:mandelate racemase [Komagataeibacter intermedius]|uniref:Mandelate racemase n=3 Tax=Komagataeibacter TaxID=1434011 RepID=A0A2V4RF47_9PROT|nr:MULTISPECIES: enolase C-terminal domain-like protein [Komagataeibacter]AHI27406.1 putative mandelate racemase/muconate lactonizingenzyme [Komagataeibacter xylinus E25]RFP01496.1 mandelate racemase [Komagataeibacter xylinus]KPH85642.1 putative mandelate racemase/muconate lactonizingenzyme [Komagataeibacter intermedius AF2]MCF3637630.1 mandelate racemase [Komagataeibacter intermedius]PYD68626.1 mandelate racemase [Komagataeibacter swingsii]
MRRPGLQIDGVTAQAFTLPTDSPEADGTMTWSATTVIVVHVTAGGCTGLGYTYSDAAVARLIEATLKHRIVGSDPFAPTKLWDTLQAAVRNMGRAGMTANAISAVDTAVWDLKAKLLDLPLVTLLGARRDHIEIYGSGGFTTYSDQQLAQQLHRWVHDAGCRAVKIKVGTDPARDPHRLEIARCAIGDAALFMDANGAMDVKAAIASGRRAMEAWGVCWFEEPVSSDDIEGLTAIRAHLPAPMELAAGEYIYNVDMARQLLACHAVDVLQADITRCGGVSGLLRIADLADAFHIPFSAHCAPALHLHALCAVRNLRHLEWFHDHVRIEQRLFDGAPVPHDGRIAPDLTQPGCGLTFRYADAAPFAVH